MIHKIDRILYYNKIINYSDNFNFNGNLCARRI